jgi:hypothetical protein
MGTPEEDLARTPYVGADRSKWPEGVRPIVIGEIERLGIDGVGVLHWDGRPIIVRKGVTLSGWQAAGTVLVVLATVAQGWAAGHQWACQAGLVTTWCPPPAGVSEAAKAEPKGAESSTSPPGRM